MIVDTTPCSVAHSAVAQMRASSGSATLWGANDWTSSAMRSKFRRARRNFDLMAELVQSFAPQSVAEPDDARIWATALWATLHGVVSTIISDRLDRRIDQQ